MATAINVPSTDTFFVIDSLQAAKDYEWSVRARVVGRFTLFSRPTQFRTSEISGIDITLNEERSHSSIAIYPNPSRGQFNLRSQDDNLIQQVKIYNLNGSEIMSLEVDSYSEFIDLSQFGSGIYQIRIITEDFIQINPILVY